MAGTIEKLVAGLEVYAELVTPCKFEWLNSHVYTLSEQIGFAPDQLRYVISLFAIYPLAFFFSQLTSPTMKHLYSILWGLAIAQFVLGSGWVHSFITSLISYLLVKFGPGKFAPQLVFAFNMIYMSASHIYRIYVDYMGWSLDFTGPQMLLVIKLTSFAYNYYDGVVQDRGTKLTETRRKYAIYQLPSLLEFFGYTYCFTTFLAGPAFELREYLDVTNGTKFKNGRKPSSFVAALSKLLGGVGFVAIYSIYGPEFPLSNFYANADQPFIARIGYIWISSFIVRCKYYFAWKVAEGSTVLSGFGFEGYRDDGSAIGWNGVANIDILGFETAQSVREGSRAWNKGTQAWLERYVYSRTGNSLLATYFCSAFWHGFYPGYYLFFMSVPIATAVNRLAYKRLRPWFLNSKILKNIYDLLSIIATSLTMNYLVMPFLVLSWENSMRSLQSVWFAGHLILIAMYAIYSIIPQAKKKAS